MFSFSTTAGGGWPRNARLHRDLGLVGAKPLKPGQRDSQAELVRLDRLGRTSVAGHEALLLRVREYPNGGLHGGHLAVIWNVGQAGYAVTMHFSNDSGLDQRERRAVLVGVAASMHLPRSLAAG